MSGHSKWAQIKHKKAATDAKRGQLFSKMVREIMVATKIGGPVLETNVRLRAAIDRAKREGLPKDNIERAVERASGTGEDARLQEFIFEATAPGGVSIIIEAITDNKNRTVAELKHIFTDWGARLVDQGSLLWNFEKVGVLEIRGKDNLQKTKEEMEFGIIESGARDLKNVDDSWTIETEFQMLEEIRKKLEKMGLVIHEYGHDYRPKNTVEISEDKQTKTSQLLDKLTEHEDIQGVYTNVAPKTLP